MPDLGHRPADPLIASLLSAVEERHKPVLTPGELRSLLSGMRPKGIRPKTVEQILEKAGTIRLRILKSDDYRDVKRVSIPSLNPTPFHYAISLRGDAYLSHGSAVYLLGLTQQQPKTIYVNKEQSKKPQFHSSVWQPQRLPCVIGAGACTVAPRSRQIR
jgi:predicted transcriptional regulator of viral defense system